MGFRTLDFQVALRELFATDFDLIRRVHYFAMMNDDDSNYGNTSPSPEVHSAKAVYEREEAKEEAKRRRVQERAKHDDDMLKKLRNIIVHSGGAVSAPSTVTSVRETALTFEPTLGADLDHLINQLRDQSDAYLRAIESNPSATCQGIGIQTGNVPPDTVGKLAEGELVDRHRASDKGTKWWVVWVTAALGVIGMLIVYAVTGG